MTSSGHRDHRRYDAYARNHEEYGDSELIPAATVVVLRDTETGLETLMLHRNSKIAFGGMWVFPGGRVDEEDTVASADGQIDELTTAAAAAAREAAEEAAVVVDPTGLVWFAHWVPPPITPRRYATFFFAARLDDAAARLPSTRARSPSTSGCDPTTPWPAVTLGRLNWPRPPG